MLPKLKPARKNWSTAGYVAMLYPRTEHRQHVSPISPGTQHSHRGRPMATTHWLGAEKLTPTPTPLCVHQNAPRVPNAYGSYHPKGSEYQARECIREWSYGHRGGVGVGVRPSRENTHEPPPPCGHMATSRVPYGYRSCGLVAT